MFTHLHVHTEYSMLDGISRIPDLVNHTKELGMESLAITDHGTFYGVVDFYSACKEAGIKPIIGCEVYVANGSRHDRSAAERSPNHLVLLARDTGGYRNLMQLLTVAHVEGFHYKPRIDKEVLEKHCGGLIALSGCPSAEIPKLLINQDMEGARAAANWYRERFGDGFFLELQDHQHIEHLAQINQGLVTLGREMDLPLVVTNDSHYVRQADSPLQDVYICIQTNTNTKDEKRLRMEDDSYYIKTPQEMALLFPEFPDALENTQRIAEMCGVDLGFEQTHLPKYHTPDGSTALEFLSKLCWQGFQERYPNATPDAEQRLRYELEVIHQTHFEDYFLVVWDIIDFVRKNGIIYGVRGSAAGSVALYCLGITIVDPLEYRLVFERFLNLERKELPDIDLDFQDDRRDEVLHYVIDRYGRDKVAQIITFGTLGARAALRDVGRALAMSYGDVDRVARMVPMKARNLADAIRLTPELDTAYREEEAVHRLVDTAKGLEGIVHHVSTHAAGVLIADEPLTGTVPLQRPTRGDENSPVMMTQFSMDPVAKLGLLKMDFLGLTNLTILNRVVNLVKEVHGVEIDLNHLPLDDKQTFELLSSGYTSDVFQLESAGMQRYIKELKPSNLGEISAMIALYRPGPMEHISRFIDAKFGKEAITYPHPSLKDLLDETYGVIVYQDQVLLILQQFAGYSLGEADVVRKAMGKKIASMMVQEREKFVAGAQAKGFDQSLAVEVFDLIEPFAGYAFNKAHSVSYALISYWTAFFKTHYPVEYMGSVLNSRLDNPDRVAGTINECFRMGIPVLLPDINRSEERFTIDPGGDGDGDASDGDATYAGVGGGDDAAPGSRKPGLRVGLSAIKSVGEGAVRPMVAERKENGPFTSIDDFCRRASSKGLNRRTLECLVKAGAFDSLSGRGPLLMVLDQVVATAQMEAKARESGQTSMFGGNSSTDAPPSPGIVLAGPDITDQEKAMWERELLGVSLSHNPLKDLANYDAAGAIASIHQIDDEMKGQTLAFVGHVASTTTRETRESKKFIIANLELLSGALEVMVWPDVLERTHEHWKEGNLVRVTGKLRVRGEDYSLACEQVETLAVKETLTLTSQETAETTPANGGSPTAPLAAPQNGAPVGPDPGPADSTAAAGAPIGSTPVNGNTAPVNGNGRGGENGQSAYSNGNQGNGTDGSARPAAVAETSGIKTVSIGVTETENPMSDAMLLREVVGILLEYPGDDRVMLQIHTGGHRVVMDLPVVTTGYCPIMQQRLEGLLGHNEVGVIEGAVS